MNIKLAENIKKLRREHYLTQEQLSEALGVTVGAVHKWERGQSMPEIRMVIEIAEFFEISVDALLGYGWGKGGMGNNIPTGKTIFSYTLVNRYLCCSCGYFEEWIDKEDIEKLKKKYS